MQSIDENGFGKQLSLLSIIPEDKGSTRTIDNDPIQEARKQDQFQESSDDEGVRRQKEPSFPHIGRMREKYSDPDRFENTQRNSLGSPNANSITGSIKSPFHSDNLSSDDQRKFVV